MQAPFLAPVLVAQALYTRRRARLRLRAGRGTFWAMTRRRAGRLPLPRERLPPADRRMVAGAYDGQPSPDSGSEPKGAGPPRERGGCHDGTSSRQPSPPARGSAAQQPEDDGESEVAVDPFDTRERRSGPAVVRPTLRASPGSAPSPCRGSSPHPACPGGCRARRRNRHRCGRPRCARRRRRRARRRAGHGRAVLPTPCRRRRCSSARCPNSPPAAAFSTRRWHQPRPRPRGTPPRRAPGEAARGAHGPAAPPAAGQALVGRAFDEVGAGERSRSAEREGFAGTEEGVGAARGRRRILRRRCTTLCWTHRTTHAE